MRRLLKAPQHALFSLALRSLSAAASAAADLSSLLAYASANPALVAAPQRGALADCAELHAATISSLSLSAALLSGGAASALPTGRAHLAAALANRATCLDGLAGARGPLAPVLADAFSSAYALVANSLALLPRTTPAAAAPHQSSFPKWLLRCDWRLLLQSGGHDDNGNNNNNDDSDYKVITVAKDGTGNFSTIANAIAFAPNNSKERVIISVAAGVYEENVEVASYKPNIMLIGAGDSTTVISGKRSASENWTTFRSATLAVSGQGFLARDMTFRNTAGPAKGQAVALRVNADLVAVYHCVIEGYQDTLYVHSGRQFYRECDIYGTIDFIFGDAAVVFQGCRIIVRKPIPGQSNVITAQSREDPHRDTGISIQNCSIVASDELRSSNLSVKTYLGRPWKPYSRTVYIKSYMDDIVDPAGWTEWPGSQILDKLYYGEYKNRGPGSRVGARVTWPGHHVMDYRDATNFSVSNFIRDDEWLNSTSFPYDKNI
ncbi:probable pectinesterase/pectinesterase inhibitor 12 [Ananas comosus]|uniref:Pectinesterase n=1 Tax=Ananas comosus TaxID=4615 RepID=A0A6P5EQ95_ANACO|nr:probable pectinesterase/pectinesterase inhibitor 12 [Ananas comosus]